MKTIICPNYLKPIYLNRLLNNQEIIFDIKLLPLSAYAYDIDTQEDIYYLLEAKHLLSDLTLNIFQPMLAFPLFIEEMVSFTRELILYNYDFNKLPEDTLQDKELKIILLALSTMNFSEYQKRDITVDNNALCLDFFTKNLFDEKIKQHFEIISLTDHQILSKELYYALNMRQEIESVAQDIVNKHNAKNSTIILCDYTNSIDTLIQIFDRYHIPYTLCANMNKPQIVYQYQSLVKFMMDPNIDNLSECLYHHVFKKAIDPSLINYLTNNITSIDHLYDRIDYDKLNTLSTDEKQVLQKRHDAFCDYFDSIKDDINLFISCGKLNVLRVAYDYLKDGQDINGINRIADILNNSLNYIRDVDDINIILSQIDKITVNNDIYQTNSVIVTSLDRPVFKNEYSYILGCTSKNYPNFSGYNKIFDEDYVAKLDVLSLNERYELYLKQIDWINYSGNHLIYSYYTNDYANKTFELALEIEELDLEQKPWPIISNDRPIVKDQKLNYAKELFFDNDVLSGSVSAFERYFSCPYSYFIQYGLINKRSTNTAIEANTIGTIMHGIMEELIDNYGKKYYEQTMDTFKKISKKYFDDLKVVYPNDIHYLNTIEQRMLINLNTSFEFLKHMEQNTRFVPTKQEQYFKTLFPDIDVPVLIKGIIDRYDTNLDYFRIIDYKSSAKELEEKKIICGLQLQLLTYMIIATKVFDKTQVGAYYYSLKNENIKCIAAKTVRSNLIEYQIDDYYQEFLKAHRLNGTTILAEGTGLDDANCIKSKDFDLDKIIECEKFIYQRLYNDLKQGKINIDPSEDGCMFCEYQAICLNSKSGINKVIYEGSLKKGKEDEVQQ